MDIMRRDDAAVIGRELSRPTSRPYARVVALAKEMSREDRMRAFRLGIVVAAAVALASIHTAAAEPVKIRVGWIVAPASLVPLLFQKPELAKHYNKSYTFDPIHFASSTLQITAISQDE